MVDRFTDPEATLIVALLDESGSMALKQADVIGGFNTFLTEQAQGPDPARLMLLKFNTRVALAIEATPIADIPPLTPKTYTPAGNTALYDAVIEAIGWGTAQRRSIDRVLLLIVTDGEENSSRTATLDAVKAAITQKQTDGDWTVVYLGPDPDGWARQTGTIAANTMSYDVNQPAQVFAGVSAATTSYRITPTWQSTDTSIKTFVDRSTTGSAVPSSPTPPTAP